MRNFFILFIMVASFGFGNDMIVRVYTTSRQSLKTISEKPLDIAGAHAGEWYDIVADQELLGRIVGSGLSYEIRNYSLEQAKEKIRGSYLDWDQITDSLRQFAANFPGLCVLDSLPMPTYEGRWIYGVKISDNVSLDEDEPGFFIDGVHHAREWATPQVVLFFADSMLRSYGIVSEITNTIDNTQIYCFPVLNVDGYVYDWQYYQGYWRKDRKPACGGTGIDPNRNYPNCSGDIEGEWGAVDEGKASHNNISQYAREVFCGPYVNAGEETHALVHFVKEHRINAYMTYHSSGEEIFWPWAGTPNSAPDGTLLTQKGNYMASLVQCLGGGTYTPGQSYYNPYPVSGGSDDWVYSYNHYVNGISCLAYGTEIGTEFYQPEVDIDNISHQNFKAMKYLAHFADSIVLVCEGVVPAPQIYSIGTVADSFTIAWHAKNSYDNHPTKWELVELSSPSIIEDNLESGTNRWSLNGFSLSTTQYHSSGYSLFSGSVDNMNSSMQTIEPYFVQAGDSVKFWCWYNLENNYDVAVVEASENTKEWYNLDTTRFTGNSGGWVRKVYSLANWAGKSIYIRFRSMTDDGTTASGFYVDDIYPVCLFANVDTISSDIADTLYYFPSHAQGVYYYYVRGYNTAWGWGDYSCLARVDIGSGIAETQTPTVGFTMPSFALSPNPFRENINIDFSPGNSAGGMALRIYNATGRLVRNYSLPTAYPILPTNLVWDATDATGHRVPAGIYFVKFEVGDFKQVKKAILLR